MPSQAAQGAPPNTPSPAADEELPQVRAEILRDQILATPDLTRLDPQALLTLLAAALLAESEDGYTRDAALGILRRARKISPEDLADAVQTLTSQLAGAMTTFWSAFIRDTWQSQDPPPQFVDPGVVARRKDLEEQEQEQNRKLALQYIENAQAAVQALGIDDKEFPQEQSPLKKTGLKLDMGKMIHGLIYKPVPAPSAPDPNAPPGWLTPPLLDRQSEAVTVFDGDIMDIVAARKLSGDAAWKKLEDRGYDRQRIVRTIYEVRKSAQDQLSQSEQVLTFIRADYHDHIEPVVKGAVLLGHAISVVNTFYGPLSMPPGAVVVNRRPSSPTPRARST
jgi:hypothetical protein